MAGEEYPHVRMLGEPNPNLVTSGAIRAMRMFHNDVVASLDHVYSLGMIPQIEPGSIAYGVPYHFVEPRGVVVLGDGQTVIQYYNGQQEIPVEKLSLGQEVPVMHDFVAITVLSEAPNVIIVRVGTRKGMLTSSGLIETEEVSEAAGEALDLGEVTEDQLYETIQRLKDKYKPFCADAMPLRMQTEPHIQTIQWGNNI